MKWKIFLDDTPRIYLYLFFVHALTQHLTQSWINYQTRKRMRMALNIQSCCVISPLLHSVWHPGESQKGPEGEALWCLWDSPECGEAWI